MGFPLMFHPILVPHLNRINFPIGFRCIQITFPARLFRIFKEFFETVFIGTKIAIIKGSKLPVTEKGVRCMNSKRLPRSGPLCK